MSAMKFIVHDYLPNRKAKRVKWITSTTLSRTLISLPTKIWHPSLPPQLRRMPPTHPISITCKQQLWLLLFRLETLLYSKFSTLQSHFRSYTSPDLERIQIELLPQPLDTWIASFGHSLFLLMKRKKKRLSLFMAAALFEGASIGRLMKIAF
ncbi:uncharacterized protein LOC111384677 [Olea europaea var. sylvestris]|uniref:uncharacterized protein LOC111384677 n=1 Tax=Olea europaea var. sylvestris TaxID=158386 RepID=UPI000C1CE53F|nr:uncharacterized protein LOC111384677 [Olea europaea var. sylvestris]